MTDQIQIKDLLLRTIIGINDEERRNRQDVLINMTLFADTRAAGVSDDIADSVNYKTITKRVIALVENSSFYLVEKMVAEIADLCLENPQVERVRVSVEKPGALRFARSVGVTIEEAGMVSDNTPTNLAYLSLGSNIEPEHNLPEAVAQLTRFGQIKAASSVWQTAAVGFSDQPDFLNAAVLLETALSAEDLRQQAIAEIENCLGRVRTENKNGPRPIDIDIILFNHDVLTLGQRRIPDPELLERAFVAIPMAEIAPDYVHPEANVTLEEIAHQFNPATEAITRRDDVELLEQDDLDK